MNKLACLPLLATVCLAAALTGCSSGSSSSDSFGAEPDYASIQQRFTAPTGTVPADKMSALFARYSEQRASSSLAGMGGATSFVPGGATRSTTATTGVHSQALQLLDVAQSGGSTSPRCSALEHGDVTGSCACPDGGSFDYDFSGVLSVQKTSGPIDASLKVRFDACHAHDVAIDGREFVRIHADRGGSIVDPKSLSMLMVADFTVSKGAENHTVDLAVLVDKGEIVMALKVDDGWVTVRATTASAAAGGGSFVVRDRNGSWTCTVVSGAGTCHNDAGETRKF